MYENRKQQRNHFPLHGRCLRMFLPTKLVPEDATLREIDHLKKQEQFTIEQTIRTIH